MSSPLYPPKQGLYDPQFEKDSCGVGFVANMDGTRSNHIVRQALEVLTNLRHRGACGCDPESGDGAGITLQVPHEFLAEKCGEIGIELPAAGQYGVGMVFLPPNPEHRLFCEQMLEQIIREEGQRILGPCRGYGGVDRAAGGTGSDPGNVRSPLIGGPNHFIGS